MAGVPLVVSLAAAAWSQEPPPPPDPPESAEATPPLPSTLEDEVGPSPGAPTVSLKVAVGLALERNFAILSSADTVSVSRMRETVSRNQFLPKLTPVFQR